MRNKETLNQDWLQKTFRVRIEIINLYKYLEFYGINNNIPKDMLFEGVVNYSLDFIENYKQPLEINSIDVKREVKGFTFTNETYDRLLNYFKLKKGEKKKGEIVEMLIEIYSLTHLKKEEIENVYPYVNILEDYKKGGIYLNDK